MAESGHNSGETPERRDMDWSEIRREFPVLDQEVDGQPLSYLDNAASSQMPEPVLQRLVQYRRSEHANVHRGVHTLSKRATDAYETARQRVADFIGAPKRRQMLFVRGATEGINLVANAWGKQQLSEGDRVILTELEHHSNIVPWQMLRDEIGIEIDVVPITDEGELKLDEFESLLSEETGLVAVNHVSNTLGTINPIKEIVEMAHGRQVPVLVDGCQALPHMPVDVDEIGADFYAFSGHKMVGPTGIGAVYVNDRWLDDMQPYQGGGEMIRSVSFEETTYATPPQRFEAGTPAIAQAIGLGAAAKYLESIGMERIFERELSLLEEATERLSGLSGVRIFGPKGEKAPVISFEVEGVHPHDVGTIFDSEGVAIRAGHHCTQPLMERLGVPATARASISFYNEPSDFDGLVRGVETVKEIFG